MSQTGRLLSTACQTRRGLTTTSGHWVRTMAAELNSMRIMSRPIQAVSGVSILGHELKSFRVLGSVNKSEAGQSKKGAISLGPIDYFN